jgi:hypothetical protein
VIELLYGLSKKAKHWKKGILLEARAIIGEKDGESKKTGYPLAFRFGFSSENATVVY